MVLRRFQRHHPPYSLFTILLFSAIVVSNTVAEPSMTVVTIADPAYSPVTPPSISGHRTTNNNNADSSASDDGSGGFWLTTDLLSAEFRKGCLSTALCHDPKFKLINTMTINKEQSVMSWPASGGGDLVQDHARSFVTYWTQGDPEDIAISCQIAGTDPSFGFSRVCDETPSKRVFNDAAIQRTLNGNSRWREESNTASTANRFQRALGRSVESAKTVASNDAKFESVGGIGTRMIVELRGRCFNATLAVRKHLKQCPWCPDPNVQIAVAGQTTSEKEESSVSFQQKLSATDALFLHNLLIVAISGAVVFGLTGFCCAIVMHCRYRKRKFRKGGAHSASIIGAKQSAKRLLKFAPLPSEQKDLIKQQQYQQDQQQQQCVIPVGASSAVSPPQMRKIFDASGSGNFPVDLRYETPWDKKYRPLPHQWMEPSIAAAQNNSHYQTLTLARSGNNNNNTLPPMNNNNNTYDCALEHGMMMPPPHYEAQQQLQQLQQQHQQQQQTSSSSIATCSARSAGESSSSNGSHGGASTSATTIGCGSLGSSGGCAGSNCCGTVGTNVVDNGTSLHNNNNSAFVSISPVVNHPGALFASLKQNECNGHTCGTLSRTPYVNNNTIGARELRHNTGMSTQPHTNPYVYQQHYQHESQPHSQYPNPAHFGPPPPPPPLAKITARHDDSGLDSV